MDYVYCVKQKKKCLCYKDYKLNVNILNLD